MENPGRFRGFAQQGTLGCDSLCGPARDLLFGAEPVFQIVAVLPAARLIEFIRTAADLFADLLGRRAANKRWFLFCLHWNPPFEGLGERESELAR